MSVSIIRKNYQITLPAEIRRSLHCKVGDMIEIVLQKGEVVLKPKVLVDKEDAWFWSKKSQQGEKEADEDIKAGRVYKASSATEAIKRLKK